MLIYGKNPVLECLLSDKIEKILFSENIHITGTFAKIFHLAKQKKIQFQKVPKIYLDKITNCASHQGVAAYISEYKYYDIDEVLKKENNFILILDEIYDPHNLGAILRTSDAAKIDAVVIPKRRSAEVTSVVFKTSAGAAQYMKVCKVTNIAKTIEYLKEKNFLIAGLDLQGKNIYELNLGNNIALVIGGENKGLSNYIKSKMDILVKIPMYGKIASLNVSVAVSIAVYEILRQKTINCKLLCTSI